MRMRSSIIEYSPTTLLWHHSRRPLNCQPQPQSPFSLCVYYSTSCDWATPWLHFIECTCLHPDGVNHNHISRENRGIWEGLRASAAILHQQRAGLVLLRCSVVSRDITQLCAVAPFSFNAAGVCVLLDLHGGVSNHGLSWSFTVFYRRLLFSVRSVGVLTAVN